MTLTPDQIKAAIRDAATKYAPTLNDPDMLIRQCEAESSFNQAAVSHCGAIGLFQLEPSTAKDLGVDPRDYLENIRGGCTYMEQLFKQFRAKDKALAAYNWGAGNLRRCVAEYDDWRDHLPTETKNYLTKILPFTGEHYDADSTHQA